MKYEPKCREDQLGDSWHVDEVFITIRGQVHYHAIGFIERETFVGALHPGERVLQQLSFTAWRAKQGAHRFRTYDKETMLELYRH